MKINLMPGRVRGQSSLKPIWGLVVVLILAELIGLGLWQKSLRDRETQLIADTEAAKTHADAVHALEREASAERAKVKDIDQKVKFVQELQTYNEARPNLYQNTIEYTLNGIRYTSMSAAQNVMQIGAWAPTLADAGRYLLFMQNSPDFSAVRISGVPGYPPGGQTGGGGGAGPGESGAALGSGAFAPPPDTGASGLNSGGGVTNLGPPGGFAPGGQGAAGAEAGGPPGGAFGPGAPGGGGQGGGGGRTIYGGAYQNAGARNLPPKPPQGFPFTVTAQLVKPIMRPLFGVNPQQPGFGGPGAFGPGAFGPEAGAGGPIGPGGSASSAAGPGGPEAPGMPGTVNPSGEVK